MDEEDPLANFAFADISSDEADEVEAAKSRRTGQSEEAWRAIQKEYEAKVENGNVKTHMYPANDFKLTLIK